MSATLTAPSIASTPPIANDLSERLYRLDVRQYEEMTRLGILTESDKVELLEGLIVAKMTKHGPHIVATGLLQDALTSQLPRGWHVSMQDPIATIDSEPEPDAKIVRGRRRDYVARHPTAGDVPVVIEVADTSLSHDRTVKKRIYARGNIQTYWIVNLNDRRVEVHEDPTGARDAPDYRKITVFAENQTIPVVLDGREVARIAVNDLLP